MRSSTCLRKVREHIGAEVKHRLAHHANFACSICGEIPIVFHHIEEWAKNFSNDEGFIIPICDKCHRGIHGEGGSMFSKDELYEYKAHPQRPLILTDKLPLDRKRSFAFFVGSNFVASGEKVSLFNFADEYSLMSIDTSAGILRLSILFSLSDGEAAYLIRDNVLMIDTRDVWNIHYSRNSLKIWRGNSDKSTMSVELVIKPDVIILKEMNTSFNGKPFRVYKLRKPQKHQVDKIAQIVKQFEELYREVIKEIDSSPHIAGTFGGIDVDTLIKQTKKDTLKTRMEQILTYELGEEFNWDWRYYLWVLNRILSESSVFGRGKETPDTVPLQVRQMYEKITGIKEKYADEFLELKDIVVEYNEDLWLENIQV